MTVHEHKAEETTVTVTIIPNLLISNCGHGHKLVSQVISHLFAEMQIGIDVSNFR